MVIKPVGNIAVIPANAGVILAKPYLSLKPLCYPRECGGDPMVGWKKVEERRLSPRMRG